MPLASIQEALGSSTNSAPCGGRPIIPALSGGESEVRGQHGLHKTVLKIKIPLAHIRKPLQTQNQNGHQVRAVSVNS